MPFFSIRKQQQQDYNTMQGTSGNLQQCSFSCQCFYHAVSEQSELLLLISRPPLHCLVTQKEQNSTHPPILVKNTTANISQTKKGYI
jgi:hypothetical protein